MSFPYTVQDFVDAYKTTGVKPASGRWKRDGAVLCLCPLATLACSKVGLNEFNRRTPLYPLSVVTRQVLGITEEESDSFVAGVDGNPWGDESEDDPAIFNLGRQVRLVVFPDFPPLPLAPTE
jgi:hypothetical protein